MSKNDGGPAFARPFSKSGEFTDSPIHSAQEGLSVRDYFAAKVYAAMIVGGHWPIDSSREDQARMAYVHADAMIAERAK